MKRLVCILLLGVAALLAAPDTNVTGTWTGSFNLTAPDGQTKDTTAHLVLKQNGAEITGSVGPNEGEQHTITKGKIEGEKISLESADGAMVIKFDLALSGDRLSGDVTATGEGRSMKAKLDVKRAK
jgi:hypothetical protein